MGVSHKEHKEHKDGFWRWGFTPYPECALIVGDLQVAFNAESQRRGEAEFLNRVDHVDHVDDFGDGVPPHTPNAN